MKGDLHEHDEELRVQNEELRVQNEELRVQEEMIRENSLRAQQAYNRMEKERNFSDAVLNVVGALISGL